MMDHYKKVSKKDLLAWVSKSVENENFEKYEIVLDGTSEKCDGYIGEIVFITVMGVTNENKEKVLNLVVKHSKENDYLRDSPFGLMFIAEIHFYEKVYPLMEKFQKEKKPFLNFNAVPKCLKTFSLEKKEVLIFENLKTQGYELYDRKKPLNLFHVKAVLEEFGKFHALSFALRDQRRAEFESILENYPNFMGNFLTFKHTRRSFGKAVENALKALTDRGDLELVDKFKKLCQGIGNDPADILAKLLELDETDKHTESVIAHGDCWVNNLMFKYEDSNRTSPSKLMILDWQISHLRSPAIDLCYFLYSTTSAEELQHFDELMKIYYTSFSSFLRVLGSNPEKLFPYSAFKAHWRKYSTFGLIFSALLLTFVLCDKENAPAFEDLQDEQGFEDMLSIDISNNELFCQRFKDVVKHYFEFKF